MFSEWWLFILNTRNFASIWRGFTQRQQSWFGMLLDKIRLSEGYPRITQKYRKPSDRLEAFRAPVPRAAVTYHKLVWTTKICLQSCFCSCPRWFPWFCKCSSSCTCSMNCSPLCYMIAHWIVIPLLRFLIRASLPQFVLPISCFPFSSPDWNQDRAALCLCELVDINGRSNILLKGGYFVWATNSPPSLRPFLKVQTILYVDSVILILDIKLLWCLSSSWMNPSYSSSIEWMSVEKAKPVPPCMNQIIWYNTYSLAWWWWP